MKILFLHIISFVFLGFTPIFCQLPIVKVSPAELDVELLSVGEIYIRVENISGVRAYSIQLSYDSQKMRCLGITRETFFSNWNTFFYASIDSNSNLLNVDEAILGLGTESGSGNLFKVRFLALEQGDMNINFLNADLRDSLNNLIEVQTENGVIHIVTPTSTDEVKEESSKNLLLAFPNPFNSSTKIEFTSSLNEEIQFSIFSILGEMVFFSESKFLENYSTSFIWNGKDMRGNILPSGIYFLSAKTKTNFTTFKLVILK